MSEIETTLIPLLRALGRRWRLRLGQRLAVRTLWLPLLAAGLVLLAGRLWPLPDYGLWAWVPLGLWALVIPGYSLLRPLSLDRVAQRADAELSLRDRLATWLELGHLAPARAARFDPVLVAQQGADAQNLAQSLDPRRAFSLRWPRRPLALAAVCLAAALALAFWPNPLDQALAERAAISAWAEEQADALEELVDELAADDTLDPAEREELLRQLRQAAEGLRANPGDREEALADLARLQESLRQQLDPQSAARQAALQGLAADLADLAGSSDRDPALDEAARLLQDMAQNAAQMSPEEQGALAGALEEAAARLAGSDPDLAQALSQLAQGVRSGQPGAGSQGAQQAAQALRDAQTDAALQKALNQALNQAQAASSAMAQAGQQGQGRGQGQGQGEGQGEGQGQGQGLDQNQGPGDPNNQGQGGQGGGQGQGQGQVGSGGGTSARTGQPSTRTGRAGDPTQPNKAYQVSQSDTVFAPWQQGQPGEPDFVPGRQTGQGQETAREQAPQPGSLGAALVPYAEVYASYAAAAAESMEREYVPAGLKDYVREYFTLLEP